MTKRNNNQQRQNTAHKQARADMWDMLNAFVATPDIHSMHFANEVGELIVAKVEQPEQRKRMGFDCTYAVGGSEIDASDDDCDNDDEYNKFIESFIRWLD